MRALALNGTLKPSPDESSTEALTKVVLDALAAEGVEVEEIRLVDHPIAPGVVSEAVRPGDAWPAIHDKLLAADILIMANSDVAWAAIERDQAGAGADGRDAQ